jgi:hypothetical protein
MNRALLIFTILTVCSTPAYAKTWAAQFPFGDGELSPVFHARSLDKALAKATEFCKRTELCRNQNLHEDIKASTATGAVGYSNLFVTTSCQQASGEQVYVTVSSVYDDMAGREDGKKKGEEILQSAGYAIDNCSVHAVYGVKSRERLQSDLTANASTQDVRALKGEIRTYRVQRRKAIRTIQIME